MHTYILYLYYFTLYMFQTRLVSHTHIALVHTCCASIANDTDINKSYSFDINNICAILFYTAVRCLKSEVISCTARPVNGQMCKRGKH